MHTIQSTLRAFAAGIVLLCATISCAAQSANCGGEGQPACTISPASYAGKKPGGCPAGSFFDMIDGGTCWSCPAGYNRSVTHVKSADACVRPPGEQFSRATRHRRATGVFGTDCPSGQFWDGIDGHCYSCPAGFNRTAYHINDERACARGVPPAAGAARHISNLACPSGSFFDLIDGGTCWRCPQGYVRTLSHVKAADACAANLLAGMAPAMGTCREGLINIGGACSRRGNCGANNGRPCLIGERVPSCNEGLREDFKNNRCVPLRPGETPFTAGLVSLTDFYGDGLRAVCQQIAGAVRIPVNTDLAVGANCTKDIMAGVACGFVVDRFLGAGYTDAAGAALGAGATAAQFQKALDDAYKGTCSRFAERLSRATRGPRGSGILGTDCPSGQFWDPNGYCYSCPSDYTRTLNHVDGDAACVDKFGGELLRAVCSAQEAVTSVFASPAVCSMQMLRGGLIPGGFVDFTRASQDVCMATGEFVYTSIDALQSVRQRSQQSAEKLQSGLRSLISKIQNSPAYRSTAAAGATANVALSGADLVRKLEEFPACAYGLSTAGAAGASPPAGPSPVVEISNKSDLQVKVRIYRAVEPVANFARQGALDNVDSIGWHDSVIQPGHGIFLKPQWSLSGRPVQAHYLELVTLGREVIRSVCEIRDNTAGQWEIHSSGTSGAATCKTLAGVGTGATARPFAPAPPHHGIIAVYNYLPQAAKVCGYFTSLDASAPCRVIQPGQLAYLDLTRIWQAAGHDRYNFHVQVSSASPPGARLCEIRDTRDARLEVNPAAGPAGCQVRRWQGPR